MKSPPRMASPCSGVTSAGQKVGTLRRNHRILVRNILHPSNLRGLRKTTVGVKGCDPSQYPLYISFRHNTLKPDFTPFIIHRSRGPCGRPRATDGDWNGEWERLDATLVPREVLEPRHRFFFAVARHAHRVIGRFCLAKILPESGARLSRLRVSCCCRGIAENGPKAAACAMATKRATVRNFNLSMVSRGRWGFNWVVDVLDRNPPSLLCLSSLFSRG